MDNLHSFSRKLMAADAAAVIALCGGTFTASAAGEAEETGVNMSLLAGGSVIGMKFRIVTSENIGDLTVTVDDKDVDPDTSGAFTIPEYSMNMGQKHSIVVKMGSTTLATKTASVASYLNTIKANKTYSDIATNMLLYGSASQDYFGITDNPVGSGLSGTQYSNQEIDGAAFDKESFNAELSGKAVSYYGMNLSLKDRTTLTLFFKKSDDSTTAQAKSFLNDFTFGDKAVSAAENGDSYLTISTAVSATALMDPIELTNGTVSAEFSPVQYIAAAQDSGDERLASVCKALYAYGLAASNFTEPEEPAVDDPEPLLEAKNTVHTGLATQYNINEFGDGENNLGQAMLRDVMGNNTNYAAISTDDYNQAKLAGAFIEVTYGSNSTKALVIDTFGGDNHDNKGNVDLDPKAFAELKSTSQGDIEVTWKIIPYEKEHVNYRLKDNKFNAGWFAIQVYDHKYPIWSLEVKKGDEYVNVPRENFNYFIYDGGFGDGPYTIRLTDIYGHVIVDENVDLSSGSASGNVQFPD